MSRSHIQAPQPIFTNSSIQNDSYKHGKAVHKCRKMVHIPRFKRCLFSHSSLSRAQGIPLIFVLRPSLSVLGSTIRPVIGTKSLYLGGFSRPSSPSFAWPRLSSLRAIHIPGVANRPANILKFRFWGHGHDFVYIRSQEKVEQRLSFYLDHSDGYPSVSQIHSYIHNS